MSDYLAVGGVSAVLCAMLSDALTTSGPSSVLGASTTPITAISPDLIVTGADEQPQLNVFMYYVSLNPALRNSDLPSRNGQGVQISNPPLALNLHYLVTAYGSKQFDAEILLGWAMKVFHDTPVVPPTTIQGALTALAGQASAEAQLVSGSTLAEQIEHLRITPETLTTEEIYRLWAAFEVAYRPSTAFQVSVVVIQDLDGFPSSLPVQTRTVTVQPLALPAIAGVSPSNPAVGEMLTITGANFLGDAASETLVSFDYEAGITPDTVSGSVVRVTLPGTLQAGTHTVQVQRQVAFPGTSDEYPGFSSDPATFQLIPTIENASPVAASYNTSLALTISPAVGRAQHVALYVDGYAIPIDQRPVTGPAQSTTLDFPIASGVPGGLSPLQIEVDGAPSALSPLGGGAFSPQIDVT